MEGASRDSGTCVGSLSFQGWPARLYELRVFSPDGRLIAFHQGEEGARQLFVIDLDAGESRQVVELPGDNRDPTWMPDGKRLIFSSNQKGTYDLYSIHRDGTGLEQLTDLGGEALEPTVSPLRYSFFAVNTDGCSPQAEGSLVDVYDKVVFTLRHGDPVAEEIWFTSVKPSQMEPIRLGQTTVEISEHNAHQGRISPQGSRCREPAFSGDGLNLTWSCEDKGFVVQDVAAHWDQSFDDAVEAIGRGVIEECSQGYDDDDPFDWKSCLQKMERRYTRYVGRSLSNAADGLSRPAYSTNHLLMLADGEGRAMVRERSGPNAEWQAIAVDARGARNIVWSPDGTRIAFDARPASGADDDPRMITVTETDYYLQTVRNLHQFPELSGEGRSEMLQKNDFVVRPGDEREFYALYEKLRYRKRPQFVTADAVLQAFRDEFMRILESAEEHTAQELTKLSQALFKHYAARFEETNAAGDRYMAVYFAVPSVYLQAAANLKKERDEEDEWGPPARVPILPKLAQATEDVLQNMLDKLRPMVSKILASSFAHVGIGELDVPSRTTPAKIDWSQFQVRGNYAENDLAGYFMAMSWYAQ
ncbi:MAG: DUF3160 domain-containing protein, partial [Bradymonadaceae bacterium]